MLSPLEQRLIGVGLAGLGLYFAVQLARGLAGYRRYRRVLPTAILTWEPPPPAQLRWLTALGVLGAVTAALNAARQRPWYHVLGLGLMAAYFLVLVPLARRIRLGLYRDGVWAHRGFVPWGEIARIAFVESPQVVLLIKPRHGGRSHKLPVPAAEYGAVRRVLEDKAREGALHLEPAILGL